MENESILTKSYENYATFNHFKCQFIRLALKAFHELTVLCGKRKKTSETQIERVKNNMLEALLL